MAMSKSMFAGWSKDNLIEIVNKKGSLSGAFFVGLE